MCERECLFDVHRNECLDLEEVVLDLQSVKALGGLTCPCIRLGGLLNRVQTSVLLDTGASANFVSAKVAGLLGVKLKPSVGASVRTAAGQELQVLGRIRPRLQLGGFVRHIGL